MDADLKQIVAHGCKIMTVKNSYDERDAAARGYEITQEKMRNMWKNLELILNLSKIGKRISTSEISMIIYFLRSTKKSKRNQSIHNFWN